MLLKKDRRVRVIPVYDKTLRPTPEALKAMEEKEARERVEKKRIEEEKCAARRIEEEKKRITASTRADGDTDEGADDSADTNQLIKKLTPEEAIEAFSAKVEALTALCSKTQKVLYMQILRGTTLTEVSRFLNRYAPNEAYRAIHKMLSLWENNDDWWAAQRDTAVWQWASELVPEYASKWRKAYDTKYGPNK